MDDPHFKSVASYAPRDMKHLQFELLGYNEIREVKPDYWCGLRRFMFTTGVCCGLDETGYLNRFCFDTWMDASLFLAAWDGHTLPEVGIDGCTAIK